MIVVGELSLWIALLMAIWGTGLSCAGGALRRADLASSGARGIGAACAFTGLACAGLLAALLAHDVAFRYVASHTTANLPAIYTIAAFWGGHSGSLLFAALALSTAASIVRETNRHANRELMSWVSGTLGVVLVFLLAAIAFGSNPFQRLDWIPDDGRGLDPRLQHPGAAIRLPFLYTGLVAATVPFAFAVAALIARRFDREWHAAVRRWALASWCFLSVAIVVGLWSAYAELGSGGYWVSDATGYAALLPWVTGTALLRGIAAEEERGTLRTWNVALALATGLLAIVGIFITRSGGAPGVAAFAPSPVGTSFGGLAVVVLVASVVLVGTRRNDFATPVAPAPVRIVPGGRRRRARHVAYAGMAVVATAFGGHAFREEYTVAIKPGETVSATDPFGHRWTFTGGGVSRFELLNREVLAVSLRAARDGGPARLIATERRQHIDSHGRPTAEPSANVGMLAGAQQDVYVVLVGVSGGDQAVVRIIFNPLAVWLWVGGTIVVLGGLVATASRTAR